MNEDLVSIVVPVYNVEKYINRCLLSISNQTYRNIQVIMVNDGSMDQSTMICQQYVDKDNRFNLYSKDNGGLSDARNFGIKFATGRYICFFDSDDYIDERMIEILYKNIKKYGANISCSSYLSFTDGNLPTNISYDNAVETFTSIQAIQQLFKTKPNGEPLNFGDYAWNKMYERSLFQDITYPVGRKMEDLGTTYRLFEKCDLVTYNPTPLYYYYQRDDSIIHNKNRSFYIDKLELSYERYISVKQYLPDYTYNDLYMIRTVLGCLPYVGKSVDNVDQYRNMNISQAVLREMSVKELLRLFMFKINYTLYTRIFEK